MTTPAGLKQDKPVLGQHRPTAATATTATPAPAAPAATGPATSWSREELSDRLTTLKAELRGLVAADRVDKVGKDAGAVAAAPYAEQLRALVAEDAMRQVDAHLEGTKQKLLLKSRGISEAHAAVHARSIADWDGMQKQWQPAVRPGSDNDRAAKQAAYSELARKALLADENLLETQRDAAKALRKEVRRSSALAVVEQQIMTDTQVVNALKATDGVVRQAAHDAGSAAAGSSRVRTEVDTVHERADKVAVVVNDHSQPVGPDADALVADLEEEAGTATVIQVEGGVKAAAAGAKKSAAVQHREAVKAVHELIASDKKLRDRLKADTAARTERVLSGGGDEAEQADLEAAKTSSAAALRDGLMGSRVAVLGQMIDSLVPKRGSQAELDAQLRVNGGGWYVGLRVRGKLERDDETDDTMGAAKVDVIRARLTVTVTGGGDVGGGSVSGGLGFFTEAASKTGDGVAQMMSYGLYRHFVESSAVPRELSNALWGMGGASRHPGRSRTTAARVEAHAWSEFVEACMSGKDEAWAGLAAGVSAEAEDDVASVESEVLTGHFYDKQGVKAAKTKTKVAQDRARLAKAALTGGPLARGAEAGLGNRRTKWETQAEANAGPLSGGIETEFTWHGTDWTGYAVKGTFGLTVPSVLASRTDLATTLVKGATRLSPMMHKALKDADGKAKADGEVGSKQKKALAADLTSEMVGVQTFADEAVDFGKAFMAQSPDVASSPMAAVEQAAQEAAEDATSLTGFSKLKVSATVSNSRDWDPPTKDRKVATVGRWPDKKVKLEVRSETGLELGVQSVAKVKFKRSERIVRVSFLPKPMTVD